MLEFQRISHAAYSTDPPWNSTSGISCQGWINNGLIALAPPLGIEKESQQCPKLLLEI